MGKDVKLSRAVIREALDRIKDRLDSPKVGEDDAARVSREHRHRRLLWDECSAVVRERSEGA